MPGRPSETGVFRYANEVGVFRLLSLYERLITSNDRGISLGRFAGWGRDSRAGSPGFAALHRGYTGAIPGLRRSIGMLVQLGCLGSGYSGVGGLEVMLW